MLYLHHEELPSPETLGLEHAFNVACKIDWLMHPIVKQLIESIDGNTVIAPNLYDSPILGAMGPERLAGGTKLLIWMLNQPDLHFPAKAMGDNCAYGIYLVSTEVDCHLQFNMYLPEFYEKQVLVSPNGTVCDGKTTIKEIGMKEGWWC